MNPHQRGSTTGTTGTASTLAGWGGSGPCLHPRGPFASLSSTLVLAHTSLTLTWHWGSCAGPHAAAHTPAQ